MFEWDDKPCKGLILRQTIPVTTFRTGGDHSLFVKFEVEYLNK